MEECTMSNTLVNLRDIRFVLYEMLGVETLTEYEYFADHSRETFDTVLDAAYRLAREVCWPAYVEMDRIGATYDPTSKTTRVPKRMHTVWQAYKDGGWHGQTAPVEVGGQQCPSTVAAARGREWRTGPRRTGRSRPGPSRTPCRGLPVPGTPASRCGSGRA
jgi:butyryl-CoA dehydrogenase